ncbi:response regulator [Candidatus Saccharibacteria bacterium]|nr:response regulator [Candidatus Saccharibacteria bacterium]
MIYVIDDDEIMAGCIARACEGVDAVRVFDNAIEAVQALDGAKLPNLIFLDILLTGPDGFTFLNELASYVDTAKVPVVVVSSLDFAGWDLRVYGVVEVLDKATMTPEEIRSYAEEYC